MPAIFATSGEVIRTFLGIAGTRAGSQGREVAASKPFNVNAVQGLLGIILIGLLSFSLACLRTQRVVLPLDESISKQQAEAAFSIAARRAESRIGGQGANPFQISVGTTAVPRLVPSQRTTSGRLQSDLRDHGN